MSIKDIAESYFSGDTETKRIGAACKAIYKTLANNGTWGLSALSRMPTAGIDWESLDEDQRRRLNNLAAMLYHGVQTESGILMRMNSVPRSIAEQMGRSFDTARKTDSDRSNPRDYLGALDVREWERNRPSESTMSGADYQRVWRVLSGEESR